MPCKPAIARLQLKGGKTEVKNRVPFTIKLVKDSTEFKQLITAVMDTGSKFVGVCSYLWRQNHLPKPSMDGQAQKLPKTSKNWPIGELLERDSRVS